MPPPDDHTELVAAARAGDRDAMNALLSAISGQVFAVCRRVLGNDADASDATQNALIAIVRGLARFDGRSSFATWSYRIATNAALDEARRRSRRPVLVDHHASAVADSTVDPSSQLPFTTTDDRMLLAAALARLSDEFRTAVVLRDVADLSYTDIAEMLDVPIGTVRSRIARARAMLAEMLGTEPSPPHVKGDDHD